MNKNGEVGLYCDPIDDRYEQRGDGRWYLKPHPAQDALVRAEERAMPVGDINSDEKGSGARALGPDKEPLQWVPVRLWLDYFMSISYQTQRDTGLDSVEIGLLLSHVQALSEFQEGKCSGRELTRNLGPQLMVEACRVFEYGSHKYLAWNWLKGMPWSVVTGCALRHAKAVFEGEVLDPESGLPHTGHFACNLIMLGMFYSTYPEGNDFPGEKYFE